MMTDQEYLDLCDDIAQDPAKYGLSNEAAVVAALLKDYRPEKNDLGNLPMWTSKDIVELVDDMVNIDINEVSRLMMKLGYRPERRFGARSWNMRMVLSDLKNAGG